MQYMEKIKYLRKSRKAIGGYEIYEIPEMQFYEESMKFNIWKKGEY